MKATDKLKKVKVLLGLEVKLEQMKLEDGAVLEAESFEAGKEVFVVAEEDKVALPVGEYEIEGGKVLVVSEEGLIGEIKEAEAKEEPKEEVAEEVEAAEEPKEEDSEKQEANEEKYATRAEYEELKALVEKLVGEKEELSTEVVEEATEEVVEEKVETELSEETKEVEGEVKEVELSKEEVVEEAKPFKHNPEVNLSSSKNTFSNRDKKLGNIYRIINSK